MKKAKETVGKVACLAGNVPLDLLCTGTPDEVKAYCQELIDVAGRGWRIHPFNRSRDTRFQERKCKSDDGVL